VNDTNIRLNDDEPVCQLCGGPCDTGWECTECGYDNRPWYYPEKHKPVPEEGSQETVEAKP
jgi:hypothetical protein